MFGFRCSFCALLFALSGCGAHPPAPLGVAQAASGAAESGAASAAKEAPPFRLVDVAAERGVAFQHTCGSRRPLTIVETMGGGAAFFDTRGDGRQDLLLISSGQDFLQARQTPTSKLFRNDGNGHFTDATATSGIVIDGYATGSCIGDIDNDGHDDLFVTGFGQNWLFRNRGDGSFQDVTKKAGILRRPGAWGTGCAFLDVNRDGLLDLYVANYVRYDPKIPYCRSANVMHGCTPNQYATQAHELYINQGSGRFIEKAAALGAADREGAGLGVLVCDFDNDGWPDIFVANDGTPNALLHNLHGRFKDVAQPVGVAYGEDGSMRAGMGTDAADIDGDGLCDLVITNFQGEPTSVYRNTRNMNFVEVSRPCGVGTATLNRLKFGVCFADLDGDGKPDLYQGNGHVYDNVHDFNDLATFEQVDQAFLNIGGGRFREVLPSTGAFPNVGSVTRAVAAGDFNDDGAMDLLINSLGRPARLLENRTAPRGRWVGVRLIGHGSNRDAIGARVELRGPGSLQVREVRSGGSYLGQSDLRPLFNLPPDADPAALALRIRWPSGAQQAVKPVVADRYVTLEEPR